MRKVTAYTVCPSCSDLHMWLYSEYGPCIYPYSSAATLNGPIALPVVTLTATQDRRIAKTLLHQECHK